MLVLLAAFGVAFLPKWGRRVAIVIGLVSASHWFLDLVVHRPDLPILPENFGRLPLLGFGLWTHPPVSALVELLLVLAGAVLYGRAAREVSRQAGQSGKWPLLSAGLIAIFGLIVLAMDYTA